MKYKNDKNYKNCDVRGGGLSEIINIIFRFSIVVFFTFHIYGCIGLGGKSVATTLRNTPGSYALWRLGEFDGQTLKNSCESGTAGWIGDSVAVDDFDPLRVSYDHEYALYFNGGNSAVIPDGSYAHFSKEQGFTIQLWIKPLTLNSRRVQILTKGADSAPNSWKLCIGKKANSGNYRLSFAFHAGSKTAGSIDARITDPLDVWNRFTVSGDGKTLKLYQNGVLLNSSPCEGVPKENAYPLTLGSYPVGHQFHFTGFLKNLAVYHRAVIPTKIKQTKPSRLLLNSDFTDKSAVEKWQPLSGKWSLAKDCYIEFSDITAPPLWSVSGKQNWENYSFESTVGFDDNQGTLLLSVGWRNAENHYQLEHTQFPSGMTGLYLARIKNGKKTIIAQTDSSKVQIPSPTKRVKLTYKIYFFNNSITALINNKCYLSAKDESFPSGKVALGTQGRKIKVKKAIVKKLVAFTPPIETVKISPLELSISNPFQRHAFYRGEIINLDFKILNNSTSKLKNSSLAVTIDNGVPTRENISIGNLPAGARKSRKTSFNTIAWKAGAYKIKATTQNGKYSAVYNVFVAPELRSDDFRFFSWGGRGDSFFMKSLKTHGFNGTSLTLSASPEQKTYFAKVCDNAVRNGQRLKLQFACLHRAPPGRDTKVLRIDGETKGRPDPSHPEQRAWAKAEMVKLADTVAHYPVITDFLFNSETENHVEPSYASWEKARVEKELGFPMPRPANYAKEKDGTAGRSIQVPKEVKKATPAIFSDDNKWYRFFKWFWQRGCGDNTLNAELAEILKTRRPDIKTTHDPFRDVPLFFRNTGLDQVGSWFYCLPGASETLGMSECLINAGKDEKKRKGINLGASLWLYSNKIGPAKHRHAGIQPTNLIVEADWLAFSRAPDVIEHFSIKHLLPPNNQLEFFPKDIYAKLADFSKKVLQPLWPTVSKLKRAPRKCAMLISFGSQLFGRKIWSGYGYSSGLAYYSALQMAHIPTDIIFDENIQRGDLRKYRVLFMHDTTHLPESVYKAIAKFAKNGGMVVCGKPFSDKISGAINFDMEFPKRSKAAYYYIKNKQGFTADQVYKEILDASSKVRKLINGKIAPYADCDSPMTFLNLLQRDGAKYLFVVNDKRTYGDYAGKKYKAVLEQGVPQKVYITLREKNCVIYDLLAHKRLKSETSNGKTVLNLDLPSVGGRILGIYPTSIGKIKVTAPKSFSPGKTAEFAVGVLASTEKVIPGIQPLKVEITAPDGGKSEFSGFFAAVNGKAKIKFVPAINDIHGDWTFAVTDLSSGLTQSVKFKLK